LDESKPLPSNGETTSSDLTYDDISYISHAVDRISSIVFDPTTRVLLTTWQAVDPGMGHNIHTTHIEDPDAPDIQSK
jgi:hypothetical protein